MLFHFGDEEQVFKASEAKLTQVSGIGEKRYLDINFKAALERAEEELNYIEKNNIKPIFYTGPEYPKRLKNSIDSPILLYGKGNFNLNPRHVISIVGSRWATEYGKQLCRQLVEELQQYNVLVVSGLALGIDTYAHKECLKQGLQTVGVPGHSFDTMYPAQNRSLAEKCRKMAVY